MISLTLPQLMRRMKGAALSPPTPWATSPSALLHGYEGHDWASYIHFPLDTTLCHVLGVIPTARESVHLRLELHAFLPSTGYVIRSPKSWWRVLEGRLRHVSTGPMPRHYDVHMDPRGVPAFLAGDAVQTPRRDHAVALVLNVVARKQ